ncbi:hypothetical protein TTHERM_00079340 (macronuclear) [Tetrahymena thermophila SB210]|uniref:Uncharacterized protein n=1 Tax=Tetrahymena thermophila (strain SB210) TaxID=312017 RepID=Q23FT0_TETTS|nr:hypothetical protein TTHERM_00079340 [Tetrahymena thermophila SB210]EAR95530.3 hypothetical protein TTHERM_00079340 [Tetrahymena thermophila SB210]|eukprot:XP_001015775.3 hypothetical protein TTHERM_00079340 [Tetrahymena thermophila SB210]
MIPSIVRQSNANIAATQKIQEESSQQTCSSINQLNSAIDISPYVHSSVFEVLQPSKNLQIKVCSIANLETIEDDVYQKLIKKEKSNPQRLTPQIRGLDNKELQRNNNDFRSQKNLKQGQLFGNPNNKNVELQKDKLSQQEQIDLNNLLKIRNLSENNTANLVGNQKKGILKQFNRQASIIKMNQKAEEEDVLIQLNMFAKKNQSSLTPKNLQFLAVKKDQLENTLNYLDQLNKANEESQRNSMYILEKDLGNKYTVKSFNKILPSSENHQIVIKSFANIPEQLSKTEISSQTNIEQQKVLNFQKQSASKAANMENQSPAKEQNTLNMVNQQPFVVTSYHSRNKSTNYQQMTPKALLKRNQSIPFQIDNLHVSNIKESIKNYPVNSPQISNPDTQSNNNTIKLIGNNHNYKPNQVINQNKHESSNSKTNILLRNSQTLQLEEINQTQINPSTLDKIDQISYDKSDKSIENTDPLPNIKWKNEPLVRSIQKQKTFSYKNEGQKTKNISFLNLQEVNNFNRDPLSSRKTADTTPFDTKPILNMENHVQLLKAKAELISPISNNIFESEDRKSTQIDSQFNSLLKKNEDDKSQNATKDTRHISPFSISQNPHKSQFKEKHEMQTVKQKMDNFQNSKFESPIKTPTVTFLESEIKDTKNSASQNPLENSNQQQKNKRLSKLSSQEFGSAIKKLSLNQPFNENINEKQSNQEQNLHSMNISYLNSFAKPQTIINTAVLSQTTSNSLKKQTELESPFKLKLNQNPSISSEGLESNQTLTSKSNNKQINEKNLEPVSQFIKNLCQQDFSDNIDVPQSIQQLNKEDIYQSERYQEFQSNQNEIFNKFISQPPYIQGKVKCGLADFIKQKKNLEMNRLKTYYKFGFSATNKDEKSLKLQHVLEGVVPSYETGNIQCSELWSEKHLKIIHDRVNFNQEKQFIQSYISYKQRNPANKYVVHKKVNSLDQQSLQGIKHDKLKKQQQSKTGCLTDRQKVDHKINLSLEGQAEPASSQNLSSSKKLNTKSSSMTQTNFKQILPSSMQLIIFKTQTKTKILTKRFIKTNSISDLRREKQLFKDLISFTDRVIKNNHREIKAYSNIKKFEDED